jgi:S1-C subfamily serine protease
MTDQYGYPPPASPGLPPRREPPPTPQTKTPLLLAILLGLIIGWAVYRLIDDWSARQNAVPRIVTARGELAADEQATIALFQNASPSVAFITSLALQRDMFGLDVRQTPQGTGSGFVWDQNGHIVTNYHVVASGQNGNVSFQVTLADSTTASGRVIGVAPDSDLAVLRISVPASRLRPIPIGTSKDLQVGQKVFAIGNPFGLDQTLTTGIVSALGRQIPTLNDRTIKDVIQTDAAINPGNSGGPLLDSAGRLIGVNTAIYSPSGASAGIGFAIPVDTVNRVVPELITHGQVIRPQLGIDAAPQSVMQRIGAEGVLVLNVHPGSAAAKAGLHATRRDSRGNIILGDIITAVDGKPVKSLDDLLDMLGNYKVGDTVRVTYVRGDERDTVEVTLQ